MHPQKLIDTVVQFEKDLAAFYENLQDEERLKEMRDVLSFMSQHSSIHAEIIYNWRSEATLPDLNIAPLQDLHERIKEALAYDIATTEDLATIYEKLSEAEALIGKVYSAISQHYSKTADVFARLSQQYKNLSDDENQHHDHIKREMEHFKKADTPDSDSTQS